MSSAHLGSRFGAGAMARPECRQRWHALLGVALFLCLSLLGARVWASAPAMQKVESVVISAMASESDRYEAQVKACFRAEFTVTAQSRIAWSASAPTRAAPPISGALGGDAGGTAKGATFDLWLSHHIQPNRPDAAISATTSPPSNAQSTAFRQRQAA
jgi:hypothetical protein